ncbi:hypothetical protein [Sphingomonas sp. MMS24-J13]|uniref:hypothetical protein n=1 Tax=Sphingomonas sp. MMS24-J13 TaxID=3238686 RepID=UPI00384EB463
MRASLLWAVAALVIAAPVSAARIVAYPIDDATVLKDGGEQGLTPSRTPAKGTKQIALQLAPDLDHEVMRVGIACSAWKVQNPIGALIRDMLAAHDPDGRIDNGSPATAISVAVKHAGTLSRCVTSGDLSGTCITRVSIDASLSDGAGANPRPIHVEVEQSTRSIGVCAGLTRGIGLISREAVIKLITAIDAPTP